MRVAGFVLVGGQSRRMGQDKALLAWGEGTLVGLVAEKVAASAGNVSLIGDVCKYRRFGYPVYPDLHPGCGPLGGLEAALRQGLGEWNLLVACDLPRISSDLLDAVVNAARSAPPEVACVAPRMADGEWQPLCAAYHARSLPAVETALGFRRFKMKDLLTGFNVQAVPVADAGLFANANTPEDWERIRHSL